MIRRTTLALAAMILMATAAQAQLKVVTEFRGMPFGAEVSQLQNMTLDESRGAIKFFKKFGDDKTFQGLPLKELHYGFVENKFALVMLSTQGPSSYNTLKAYFDTTYGEPQQPSKNVKHFSWGAGDVTIEMNFNDTSKICEITYMYRPLMSKVMSGMKKQ